MYTRLLLPIVFIVLQCLLCISDVAGYFIHIDAHAEECFFDRVTSGTKLSLMFEVAEGGFLDIDVKVRICACVSDAGRHFENNLPSLRCDVNRQCYPHDSFLQTLTKLAWNRLLTFQLVMTTPWTLC